jgi:hypothetical protein
MPAGQGKDAKRFAAAVEQGTPPGFSGDDDLARELEIVAMLRSRGAAFAPDPDTKARAKQRLMAVLAAEQGDRPQRGPRPPVPPPSAEEQTAPLGRILEPAFPAQEDVNASAVTGKMPAYTGRGDKGGETKVETPPTEGSAPTTPGARPGRHSSRRTVSRPAGHARGSHGPAKATSGLRRRAVFVGSAALVMLLAVAGGVFASRDALPGDNLYALKRVAESAGLALTFDDSAKARRHLDIASTRLDEVEQMVDRDPRAPVTPDVYASAIQEFDTATGEGSRILLTSDDTGTGDAAALGDLRSWAAQEADRLSTLRPALPVTAAADAESAIELLDRLVGRTQALTARSSCSNATSGTDDLGPLPAQGVCAPRPLDPGAPKTGTTGGRGHHPTEQSPFATTPGKSDDPTSSDVTETPGADEPPALLPGIGTDGNLLDGESQDGSEGDDTSTATRSQTPDSNGGGDEKSAPALPRLLPPVTLPPLLPGMPRITIGS